MNGLRILEAFRQAGSDYKEDIGWQQTIAEAKARNGWFTESSVHQAMDQWLTALEPSNALLWAGSSEVPQRDVWVGIIMAGNIPLVGLHDLLSCLVTGCKIQVKMSSDDQVLPEYWWKKVLAILPELTDRVVFTESLNKPDIAIATGSNNSAAHFAYYFRNIPHMLRKNRNSVSVLSGKETLDELTALGHDVFDYFGLGCRNVTHLFLPEKYAFKPLFDAWEPFADVIHHHKYANNYNYHKALLLMNLDPHMDTGFLLLKERTDIYSPVGMLNYSFYKHLDEVKIQLAEHASEIQCITSQISDLGGIPLGESQKTGLTDYADGVDTVAWLKSCF